MLVVSILSTITTTTTTTKNQFKNFYGLIGWMNGTVNFFYYALFIYFHIQCANSLRVESDLYFIFFDSFSFLLPNFPISLETHAPFPPKKNKSRDWSYTQSFLKIYKYSHGSFLDVLCGRFLFFIHFVAIRLVLFPPQIFNSNFFFFLFRLEKLLSISFNCCQLSSHITTYRSDWLCEWVRMCDSPFKLTKVTVNW